MTANWIIAWVLLLTSLSFHCRADAELLFSAPADPKLGITLTGPWKKIAQDSSKEPKSTPVVLSMPGDQLLTIKVKPRGKSRRRRDFCRFPPLRLDFPKNELKNTLFEGQNKLKLVTHCARLGSKSSKAHDRLWSEYLAYRIYNLITDNSFRVKALDIRYVDLGQNEVGHHPGFLIEHKNSVAKRIQLTPFNGAKVSTSSLEADNSALVALFQYFIGGVDYSQIRGPDGDKCCHNITPMTAAHGRIVGLPYDFDATGFVDPPYGAPLPHLKINSYTQRLYRGFCDYQNSHGQAMQEFLVAKPKIEALISGFPYISEGRRKKLQRFASGFFRKLPNQAKGVAWLDKHCR